MQRPRRAEKYGQERGPGSKGHQHLKFQASRRKMGQTPGWGQGGGAGLGASLQRTGTFPKRLGLLLPEGRGLENGVFTLLLHPPDVTLSPWSGDSKCHQRRVLTYTIPISNPLGPKSASVVETQVSRAGFPVGGGGPRAPPLTLQTLFRRGPQAGGCVVDSEVLTQGIPYQDYFYTAHRYCILGLARNKARLR